MKESSHANCEFKCTDIKADQKDFVQWAPALNPILRQTRGSSMNKVVECEGRLKEGYQEAKSQYRKYCKLLKRARKTTASADLEGEVVETSEGATAVMKDLKQRFEQATEIVTSLVHDLDKASQLKDEESHSEGNILKMAEVMEKQRFEQATEIVTSLVHDLDKASQLKDEESHSEGNILKMAEVMASNTATPGLDLEAEGHQQGA